MTCRGWILFFLLTPGLWLGTGCRSTSSPVPAVQNSLSSPEGLADYLRDLPAVQRVQIWDNPYGPGLQILTRHYEIYTTLDDPLMLRQVPSFVESVYAEYQAQLPDPVSTDRRFVIYLFAQRSQWEQFTRDFTGPNADIYLRIRKGAYAVNDVCVAYHIGRSQTFSVIGHEGWHQFNSRFFAYRLPSWLDEGVATLFETCQYRQGRFVFEPQRNLHRLGALKETLLTGRMIPLEELLVLNPGQVLGDNGGPDERVTAFYAQTYALVRFLREEFYGYYLRKYHTLMAAGLRGNWPLDELEARIASDRNLPLTVAWNQRVSPRLFSLYIDSDLKKIEKEYRAFCEKITYPIRLQYSP
ncbi:MAG: hypothetical protein WHS88_04150 [Anaerohalosphaeraceae bacterium]